MSHRYDGIDFTGATSATMGTYMLGSLDDDRRNWDGDEQPYEVRVNGVIVLTTWSKGIAEERYYEEIGRDPKGDYAIIWGVDSEGDENKIEAYSG